MLQGGMYLGLESLNNFKPDTDGQTSQHCCEANRGAAFPGDRTTLESPSYLSFQLLLPDRFSSLKMVGRSGTEMREGIDLLCWGPLPAWSETSYGRLSHGPKNAHILIPRTREGFLSMARETLPPGADHGSWDRRDEFGLSRRVLRGGAGGPEPLRGEMRTEEVRVIRGRGCELGNVGPPPRSWKDRETDSPLDSPEGSSLADALFYPREMEWDSQASGAIRWSVCIVLSHSRLWLICYNSSRNGHIVEVASKLYVRSLNNLRGEQVYPLPDFSWEGHSSVRRLRPISYQSGSNLKDEPSYVSGTVLSAWQIHY